MIEYTTNITTHNGNTKCEKKYIIRLLDLYYYYYYYYIRLVYIDYYYYYIINNYKECT